jgi:hypothetical protein
VQQARCNHVSGDGIVGSSSSSTIIIIIIIIIISLSWDTSWYNDDNNTSLERGLSAAKSIYSRGWKHSGFNTNLFRCNLSAAAQRCAVLCCVPSRDSTTAHWPLRGSQKL